MAKDVIMPVLGMNQDTGLLVSWLKREGDEVSKGEPLMEVETDKAVMEIDAPESGVLVGIRAQEGEDVPVGNVIAQIAQPGEEVAAPAEPNAHEEVEVASSTEPPATVEASEAPANLPSTPTPDPGEGARPPASPLARRLAKEGGMDIARIQGSGPFGAVLARDVPRGGVLARHEAAAMAIEVQSAHAALGELERRVDAQHLTSLLARSGDVPIAAAVTRFLVSVVTKHLTFLEPSDVHLAVRGPQGSIDLPGAAKRSIRELADLLTGNDGEMNEGLNSGSPDAVLVHAGHAHLNALRPPPYAPVTLGLAIAPGRDGETEVTLTLRFDVTSVGDEAAHAMMQDLVMLIEEPAALSVHF